jgi:hypothetical protein
MFLFLFMFMFHINVSLSGRLHMYNTKRLTVGPLLYTDTWVCLRDGSASPSGVKQSYDSKYFIRQALCQFED